MAYQIDQHGNVTLGSHVVSVPRTISLEAQAILATPPSVEISHGGEPQPAWAARAAVDAQMQQINQFALSLFPVDIEETHVAGVRCHWVRNKNKRNLRRQVCAGERHRKLQCCTEFCWRLVLCA